ncbi:MAG: hypothetical protein HXX09_00670 [Bacteroidetes bacterium]|nr:hypothetical protein [Bacteroidota bacterium]
MKKITNLMIIAVVCIFTTTSVFAQATKNTPSKQISNLTAAADFADYGYQNKSSLALITAASILNATPANEKKVAGEENAEFSAKQLLEDAKKLANGDQAVLAMITKVEGQKPEKTRGSMSELLAYNCRIMAGAVKVYQITYVANSKAEISVKSSAAAIPEIIVENSKGEIVKSESSDKGYFTWTPSKAESYKITLKNASTDDMKCVFITN